MNIAAPLRGYIDKMTSEVSGLKVLLLDTDTCGAVSMVFTQSEIIAKEVYLIEALGKFEDRQEMPHLKCLAYVRPTEENITLLCRELRKPNYGEYNLFFTNIVPPHMITRLGESDERELVKRCEEFFGDVFAVNPDTFTLRSSHPERVHQGLVSALLAMKRRPSVVRYQRSSGTCQSLASSVSGAMAKEAELFHFTHGSCVLLIVERMEDPVSPLLLPWTYQAMLHEYLTIEGNRVVLDKTPEAIAAKKIEDNEYVFAMAQDAFFCKQMYSDWGELCGSIKVLVDTFQSTCNLKELKSTGSLADLKKVMQQLPEARRLGSTVSKHVAVVGDIGDKLKKRGLMNVGQLEQDIACNANPTEHTRQLTELIASSASRATPLDVVRVAMIYFLRYEKNTTVCSLPRIKEHLAAAGVPVQMIGLLDSLRDRCGADKRSSTHILFPTETSLFSIVKGAVSGMSEESCVYTQHEPMLKKLIAQCAKGQLQADVYPVLGNGGSPVERAREVIVFIVGGATYSEAAAVHQINNNNGGGGGGKDNLDGVKVVLGTTEMLNIEQFLKML